MSKIIAIVILICIFFASTSSKVSAFSSVLGKSVFVCNEAIFVEGIPVENPKKVITIHTSTPTFAGCTQSNVQIDLTINTEHVTTLGTGTDGTWSYKTKKTLKDGTYELYLAKKDMRGGEQKALLTATFKIHYVESASIGAIIPPIRFFSWNYVSISLLVMIISLFLLLLYYKTQNSHR